MSTGQKMDVDLELDTDSPSENKDVTTETTEITTTATTAPPPKRRLTDDVVPESEQEPPTSSNPASTSNHTTSPPPPTSPPTPYEAHAFLVESALTQLTTHLVTESAIVASVEEGQALVDAWICEGRAVAVDCEGVNLGDRSTGLVTLIQIGTMSGRAFLFDVQTEPALAIELKRVLECDSVVKVMHDVLSDSKGLSHQFGILLQNVFDTQVAHRVVEKRNATAENKEDRAASLDRVCRVYGGAASPYKDAVKGVYKRCQNFWSGRPLTDLQIAYAAADVLCLVPRVYERLLKVLEEVEGDVAVVAQLCGERVSSSTKESNNDRGHGNRGNRKRGRGQGQGQGQQRGQHNSRGYYGYNRGQGQGQGQNGWYDYDYGNSGSSGGNSRRGWSRGGGQNQQNQNQSRGGSGSSNYL